MAGTLPTSISMVLESASLTQAANDPHPPPPTPFHITPRTDLIRCTYHFLHMPYKINLYMCIFCMTPLGILIVLKCLFALSTCVQLHIHRVDNQVQHMSPVMHGSSSGSPLLSRDASAAIGCKLTGALSDLWLFMFGAGAVYSVLTLTTCIAHRRCCNKACAYTLKFTRGTHTWTSTTSFCRHFMVLDTW